MRLNLVPRPVPDADRPFASPSPGRKVSHLRLVGPGATAPARMVRMVLFDFLDVALARVRRLQLNPVCQGPASGALQGRLGDPTDYALVRDGFAEPDGRD